MKNYIFIVVLFLFFFSCNKKSDAVEQAEARKSFYTLADKYGLKIATKEEAKNIKKSKNFSSIEDFEKDLINFKKFEESLKTENKQVEDFNHELLTMKNYTENKFFALVDKYPVIKIQLIQQYGGVEKFELKKQELIKKQGLISNQK